MARPRWPNLIALAAAGVALGAVMTTAGIVALVLNRGGSSSSPLSEGTARPLGSPVVSGAPTPPPPPGYVMGVSFVDLQHGWAIESLALPGMNPRDVGSRIVKTTDGGGTWTEELTTQQALVHIQFIDLQHGWAAGTLQQAPSLLTTSDGGASWEQLDGTASGQFVTDQVGWRAADRERLEKTTDRGRTWSSVPSPCPDLLGYALLSFATPNLGWMLCTEGGAAGGFQGKVVYQTEDGGASWQEIIRALGGTPTPDALGPGGVASGVSVLDRTHAWLEFSSSSRAFLMKTTDGGRTWKESSFTKGTPYTWISDIHFLDAQRGFMAAAPGSIEPLGQVYATSDGGDTWEALPVQTSAPRRDPVLFAESVSFRECATDPAWRQPSLETVLASPAASIVPGAGESHARLAAVHDRHIYLVGPGDSLNRSWIVYSGEGLNPGVFSIACPSPQDTAPVGSATLFALIDYQPLSVFRQNGALFVRLGARASGITTLVVDGPPTPNVTYFLTPDDQMILSCRNVGCDG
jgi:photosystem II stability/assembly factor-like uncharacterized protein